jgi:hypothetical protein
LSKNLFDRFYHSRKGFWILAGELGQDFAIKINLVLLEEGNEFAVRETQGADGSVDLDIPESAEVILFIAAIAEGVSSGMGNRYLGLAFFFGAAEAIAFSLG